MATSFQDLLREKAKDPSWKDRNRNRMEWLGALNWLFDQIQGRLRKSDPEGLIEDVRYEVERVEGRLGIYDAPALKIRLDTNSVDVLPVGRYVPIPSSLQTLLLNPGNRTELGDLSGGRVDITDGERRHLLLRSIEGGNNRWFAVMANQVRPVPLDQDRLEAILLDLLS